MREGRRGGAGSPDRGRGRGSVEATRSGRGLVEAAGSGHDQGPVKVEREAGSGRSRSRWKKVRTLAASTTTLSFEVQRLLSTQGKGFRWGGKE
jgi:hypothetical protein